MISTQSFITQYELKTKDIDISNEDGMKKIFLVIDNIIHPKKYISFNRKQEIVKKFLKDILYKDNNGNLIYNSCEKYYKSITTLLSEYTELKIEDNTFDLLSSHKILPYIIAMLGSEYDIYLGIIDMYMDDIKDRRINIESL